MARILVIDDSPSMREVLGTCLPEFGHSVVLAADGADGLALADPATVDLILSDVEMPYMGGISMCESLKRDLARRHVPVLLMTGRLSAEVRRQAVQAGACAVLEKPFAWDELLTELGRNMPAGV